MKASVFVGVSLDGFIARANGAIDWLPDDVEPHGYEEFMAGIDALIMGRKTYETVLGFGEWPYAGKPVAVLSARPLAPAPAGAVVWHMSGAPADIAAQLEARGVGHAYVDGGITVQRFIAAGLVQRLIVARIPILIGTGTPLFGAVPHDIRLRHVATRSFPSGLVQSEYRLGDRPDDPPGAFWG